MMFRAVSLVICAGCVRSVASPLVSSPLSPLLHVILIIIHQISALIINVFFIILLLSWTD
jgi:hypothetical protein